MAGEDIGKAEIEVTADTSHFPEDVRRGVNRALSGTDPEFKKAGEEWGDASSQGFGQRMKSKIPQVIKEFLDVFNREKIRPHIEVEPDFDKDHIRTAVRNIAREVEREVTSGGGSNIFTNIGKIIGSTIGDGIGAAFNVSGKSPLISLLIPVIGAIAALILVAVEAVYGLGAALFTLPSIIAAIAVQAGALLLVFKAAGPVISAVLSAQNAKELQEALMGVNKPLADFAKSLIPIRDFFDLLSRTAAMEFFRQLGDVVTKIFNANSRTVFFGMLEVVEALGKWFNVIGQAFVSPAFTKFIADLFKSIDLFLGRNGPKFEKFLEQLFEFLDKMLAPAGILGMLFNFLVTGLGNFLEKASEDPKFLTWLQRDMPEILLQVGDVLGAFFDLIKTLFKDIDEQGGRDFLPEFTKDLRELNAIFSSEAGQLAIKGLIDLIAFLTLVFIGLIGIIVGVIAFVYKLGDGIEWLGKKIKDFVDDWVKRWEKASGIKDILEDFVSSFERLPSRLYIIGVNMIKSFIAGMLHMKNPAADTAGQVIGAVAGAFPSSPAKYGPFSGKGAPFDRGMSSMKDFTKGIMAASDQSVTNASSAMNSNFGPGAVIANFYGQNPTPQQAQTLGTALGGGINDQLAARNARLAVRTM